MRKVLVVLFVLDALVDFGQVRVAKAAPEVKQICAYDSTRNFVPNAESLVGQDLLAVPEDKTSHKILFRKEPNGTSRRADFEQIMLHTFHVEEVVGDELEGQFLCLRDKDTNDMVYFMFLPKENGWPFITLGYADKFSRTNKGKQFVSIHGITQSDFKTGEQVKLPKGAALSFIEIIAIESGGYAYLMTTQQGDMLAITPKDFERMETKEHIDVLKGIYGDAMVTKAINGELFKGMPAELVTLSKGTPDKINDTSYHSQWVYYKYGGGMDCIYIKDGKVTDWN